MEIEGSSINFNFFQGSKRANKLFYPLGVETPTAAVTQPQYLEVLYHASHQ
jgi:hypothetical protein